MISVCWFVALTLIQNVACQVSGWQSAKVPAFCVLATILLRQCWTFGKRTVISLLGCTNAGKWLITFFLALGVAESIFFSLAPGLIFWRIV
ncbi:hypothetical protein D0N50_10440 [Erwinia billingiae]|uniref:hypothetical protein n=1 Tax=Erwinia billingiae TaxID=182337 RepID=UPI0012484FEA|nr:hypothetical protein [Erwinia billingiae]QEW32068.1 hypothetical protein D0N50_10440 [Erwinia billingiae]